MSPTVHPHRLFRIAVRYGITQEIRDELRQTFAVARDRPIKERIGVNFPIGMVDRQFVDDLLEDRLEVRRVMPPPMRPRAKSMTLSISFPMRVTLACIIRSSFTVSSAFLDAADIEAYGLRDRVAVLGAVPPERIIELFLASDLFVLASRFEGYGMALAEAIAHGLPVVSTTAGAIAETEVVPVV